MKRINFFIFFLIVSKLSFSQITITKNDGFELKNTSSEFIVRTSSKSIIPYWNNCEDGTTPDIQPGNYGVNKKPTEGWNYVSLVTRKNYSPGTYETIYSDLNNPLIPNVCYNISLDACLSNEFFLDDFGTYYYYFNPCYLRVYGINGQCPFSDSIPIDSESVSVEYKYLLWQSPLLTDSNWRTFNISFTPKYSATSIALEVYFAKPRIYTNSAVLIDNMQFTSTQKVFEFKDGFLFVPDWAKNINWYFNSILVKDWSSNEMPMLGNGEYQISFIDSTNCFTLSERKIVELLKENFQIFPNPATDYLLVKTYEYSDKKYDYIIYNTLGELVNKNQIETKKGTTLNRINISNLSEAVYWIVFRNDSGSYQQLSFVVSHP